MPYDQFGRVIRSAPAPQVNIPVRPLRHSYLDIHSTDDFVHFTVQEGPILDEIIQNALRQTRDRYSRPWYKKLWEGFDNTITNIGNYLARNGENFANITVGICIWILALGLIWWVIQHWIDDGFLWAILYVFGAAIIFGIGSFCLGIISFILQLCIAALRFVFWNSWSLLGIIMILLISTLFNSCESTETLIQEYPTETIIPYQPTICRCTAKVLNVRGEPNMNSNIYGILYRGQQVEVTDTLNGFARIEFKGTYGYVSSKYLDEVN